MTNRELIEYLQELPPDYHVHAVSLDRGSGYVKATYTVHAATPIVELIIERGTEVSDCAAVAQHRTIHPRQKYTDPDAYWESIGKKPPKGWEAVIDPPDGSRAGAAPGD